MKNKLIKFLCLITIFFNLTVKSMGQPQDQTPWNTLPVELKSYILSLVSTGKSMKEILETLKNPTQVSKEFRGLIKNLAQNPETVGNLAKKYIKEHPEEAYQEFFLAVKNGDQLDINKDVVNALIKAGIDVNTVNPKDVRRGTALVYAAGSPNSTKEMVQMLIGAGANVNVQTAHSISPLISAVNIRSKEKVKLLIDNHADVNHKDSGGQTALMIAARWGEKQIVQMLIEAKADLNAQNNYVTTALMLANRYGHEKVAQMLKEAGAQ